MCSQSLVFKTKADILIFVSTLPFSQTWKNVLKLFFTHLGQGESMNQIAISLCVCVWCFFFFLNLGRPNKFGDQIQPGKMLGGVCGILESGPLSRPRMSPTERKPELRVRRDQGRVTVKEEG